jgi:hypothetical protein
MTFGTFRALVSACIDDFADPDSDRALPPEQVEQHRRPLVPLRHVEHALEGGEGAGEDAYFLALLVDRAVVLGLGAAGPQCLDEVFGDGRDLAAEAHEARDADGAPHRRPGHPLPHPHEQVPGEERLLDPGPAAVAQFLDAYLGAEHLVALAAQVLLGHALLPGLGVGEQPVQGPVHSLG